MCECKVKLTMTPDRTGAGAKITYCHAHTATAKLTKATNELLKALRMLKDVADDNRKKQPVEFTSLAVCYKTHAAAFGNTIKMVEGLLAETETPEVTP